MDVRDLLRALPPPEPAALDRVRRRFESTRAGESRRSAWIPALAGGFAVAAAALVWARWDPERTTILDAPAALAWSDQVHLDADGLGEAHGTSRDVVVGWSAGTIHVDVAPRTGTKLSVVTEEGTIRVVGTAFSVKRDALGVTTVTEHGRVAVTCADGWTGDVTAESGPHTCLPVRAAGLLGRAEALGSGPEALEALDRGLAIADPGSAVEGELLARRVVARGEAGRLDEALSDADRYLASEQDTRRDDVARSAGRLAYGAGGCRRALPYLERLGAAATGDDAVLLATCLPPSDRTRALARAALADPATSPAWRAQAKSLLETP